MPSNQQILSDLRVVLETGHALEIMNTYKGVPFVCKAQVKRVEDDLVYVEAQHPSLICLTREKQTKVLGSDYFEPSIAQVVSVDLGAGQITLTRFAYLGTRLGERTIVRVEPRDPIPVELRFNEQRVTGELADLSMSGIGVRFPAEAYTPLLKPGANLHLRLALPNDVIVESDGAILSAARLKDIYRVSIRFSTNQSNRVAIFRYLIDRRAEIEAELKQEYKQALHE